MYLLGQCCGIIGTIITILQPQFRSKLQILICGILVNAMSCLNFVLIGQIGSAPILCLIAILQSVIAICHHRHGTRISVYESILFLFLYVGSGLLGIITAEGFVWELSRKNALELLPVIGALMSMLSVFAKGEQKTRVYLLFNDAAWVIYTAIIGAATCFASAASMISTIIALWKYHSSIKE